MSTPHGPPAFLPWPDFVRIVDAAPRARELQLQGLGEPMLHPRFFDMVEYAAAKGLRVSTNTNGTLPDPDEVVLLAKLAEAAAVSHQQLRIARLAHEKLELMQQISALQREADAQRSIIDRFEIVLARAAPAERKT